MTFETFDASHVSDVKYFGMPRKVVRILRIKHRASLLQPNSAFRPRCHSVRTRSECLVSAHGESPKFARLLPEAVQEVLAHAEALLKRQTKNVQHLGLSST